MAEDYEDDVEDGAPAPSKSGGKKKLIILVVLPLLLIVGAAAGAYFTGLADPLVAMLGGGGKTEEAAAEHADAGKPLAPPVFYELPEMLVNLNPGQGRRPSILKMKVRLELAAATDTPKIEAMLPRIVDSFQVYLRELRVEDLQGAAGMYRLREELMMRVNRVAAPAKINDVLFQDVLVQ
ncbi:Flagellar biosynthesis protein FliL [uncultured Alphaproteobacteria bacterium]|jgi:flagellar FliL protein|uniref:Flagellar protein FliL n=1 Tax=uncultured Alphaproteobacteria bacterium TaxID=91750 RepID=A0A212JPD7_9PROT|nr:Flagellar biosynthesis protein FliL [uncultured Alphaproteobacteria bacterium]